MFLVGRCSCRMKNENPGWDILMNVDWAKALEQAGTSPPQDTEVPAPPKQPEPVTTIVSPSSAFGAHVTATVRWP